MSGSTLVGAGAAGEEAALPRLARRQTAGRVRRWLGAALTIAVLAGSWWSLAPPQIGGSTSFVVVDGASMLPQLSNSDLVALRPSSQFRVGDVVGYRSSLLDRVVLHRIVRIHGDTYVFKGDNNTFLDPEQVTRAQFVGKLWFHVPVAGRTIAALRLPWVLAMLAAILVFAFAFDGSPRRGPNAGSKPS